MTMTLPRSTVAKSSLAKLAGGALLAAAVLSLAACQTTGAGTAAPATLAKPAAAEPQGPMTHRDAALYCWMKTEHGRAGLSLDKRADVVDKCIKEKMQGN